MIAKLAVLLFALVGASCPSSAVKEYQVMLPADADVVTLLGKGYKLELSKFEQLAEDWQQAAKESALVPTPKTLGDAASETSEASDVTDVEQDALEAERQREAKLSASNERYEQRKADRRREHLGPLVAPEAQAAVPSQDYGPIDEQLQAWIGVRATALIERLDRYSDELGHASNEAERVVLEVLQLNTISQLHDLVAERLPALAWLDRKLAAMEKQRRFDRRAAEAHVHEFASQAVRQSVQIEARVKGTNNPGKQWLRNVSALKRLSNEQRFDSSFDRQVLGFLSRDFSMMKRSIVLDILQGAQQVDNGLVYWAAKGRVSADFPFSAQDAIANGALY